MVYQQQEIKENTIKHIWKSSLENILLKKFLLSDFIKNNDLVETLKLIQFENWKWKQQMK